MTLYDQYLREYLDNLWRWKCGLLDKKYNTEYSTCRNLQKYWFPVVKDKFYLLVLGGLRYGHINDKTKPKYDRISDAIRRIEKYKTDGNTAHLLDASNLLDLEVIEGNHPNKHKKYEDDGEHTDEIS